MALQDRITNMANDIFNVLGYGHCEEVYTSAFKIALEDDPTVVEFETEKLIPIKFRDRQVGVERVGIIVNDELIIILKTDSVLNDNIEQCRMYMRCTDIQHGMVIIFPIRPTRLLIERVV